MPACAHTLQDFLALADRRSLKRVEDWCDACRNTQVSACRLEQLEDAASTRRDAEAWQVAVSVVVTFVGTLLAAAAGAVLARRCLARWRRRAAAGGAGFCDAAGGGGSASGAPGPFVQLAMANTI